MVERIRGVPTFGLFRQNEVASVVLKQTAQAKQDESRRAVDYGHYYARGLGQYQEILGHNGALNFLEVARAIDNPTIIDAGCGAGTALAELRIILPDAKLVGIDTRLSSLNTILYPDGRTKLAEENLREKRVEFYQDTLLNAPRIIPEGYDVFLAVGSFYDEADVPYGDVFKELYKGLRKGGIIQVILYSHEEKIFERAIGDLQKVWLPYTFTPGDVAILDRHGFYGVPGMTGTLTVGPKT